MDTKANAQKIIESSKKFLEDKKAVRAYVRGEITLEALNEKGIKLTMPV